MLRSRPETEPVLERTGSPSLEARAGEGEERSCKSSSENLVQIGARKPPAHWKSVEELHGAARSKGEFPGGLPNLASNPPPGEATRRDFLSLVGFTLSAAGLAACRAPTQNAIPLPVASDQLIAGVPLWYATTCGGCASACSLLVKQRDGRPIKIEGNSDSALFGGGTCATGQATVLSLYDDERLRGPLWHGQPASWGEVDGHIAEALKGAQAGNQKVVLLSTTLTSPSTRHLITKWGERFSGFRHVVYDPISLSALRTANAQYFGRAVVPHYAFDKARVIVGIEADFLGTWLSPVEFARQYAKTRKVEGGPALHIQCEAGLSVTGSNADIRIPVAASELGAVVAALFARIAVKAGVTGAPEAADPVDSAKLDSIANELWKHRGESLVVSGSSDVSLQLLVNALNALLGNIGQTIDLDRPSLQRQGDDAAMAKLVEEMNAGQIHTLILYGVNPGYDFPEAEQFLRGLEKVALSISFADRRDETSSRVHAVCPDHHFLESWGDAEPVESHLSLVQPTIAPLFDTRAAPVSLLKWLDQETDHYAYVRDFWRGNIFTRQTAIASFDTFWDQSLQRGVIDLAPAGEAIIAPAGAAIIAPAAPSPAPAEAATQAGWRTAMQTILSEGKQARAARRDDLYELHLYESVPLRDGRHANNPWLQELPDPITKVTWGNVASVAPSVAKDLDLREGDVISLKTGNRVVEVPVFVQPGQHPRTISVALGYGRTQVGKAGSNVGINLYPLTTMDRAARRYSAAGVTLTKTGRREAIAGTQSHFSMEGRPIALEMSLADLAGEPGKDEGEPEALPTLWARRATGDHAWGLAIDLNACTGCSACVIACQAENNVPVVGKDQVQRERSMHWMRIDRYYSGPEDSPTSVHQPMMCQHCEDAPCETVCPVLATTTSSEGLNQQTYNRCIGTRYCANNCPYKVRRFNWYNYTGDPVFNFNMATPLGRMALNPDVTVRSRGVMEKCSMCVQRIQSAKNGALQRHADLVDGDIQTACQQACPTSAIVFGDLKDPGSRASQLQHSRRSYRVLEELGTRPSVAYLKRVRHGQQT